MTDPADAPAPSRPPSIGNAEARTEREADALRRNLLRRKQQSRDRGSAKPEPQKD